MTHHERRIQAHVDLDRLNADELEAVHYLIGKLLAGSAKHGPLALASDRRDWPSEMCEEYADALFYAAFASVQRQRRTQPPSDLLAMSAVPFPATVPATDVSPLDDAYWQRHPLGSPERVHAVEEHNAAVVSAAAMAANHAEEG